MKLYILFLVAGLLIFIGCKKDNKEPPSSIISGRILYQGQPLSVRSGGVELELWQYGYQLRNKINVYVKQDGSFSARVFNGSYKMTLLKGNGPWADKPDSIDVQVNGSNTTDVTVDPYFIINNVTYERAGNSITATFRLQPVNTSRTLEAARLYIGQTTIVDQNNNMANVAKPANQIPDFGQPVTITANIPAALQTKDYLYVRVGVKTNGVAELLYSLPVELSKK
jgi:hypothetical protein